MRANRCNLIFLFVLSLLGLFCGPAFAQAPTITNISPTSGPVSTLVTLTGTNFGTTQGGSTISLSGTSAAVNSWSNTIITALVPAGTATGPFSVTVNGQSANSSTFTLTPLPSGWSDGDIGSVGAAGSATYANGAFTVKGAGIQVYGTADAFHFAYQPLSGDGTIVARVVSLQDPTGNSQAGIMVRETLAAGSTNAFLVDWTGYINLDERTSTGGSTSNPSSLRVTLPYWVRLNRSGNTFTSYTCMDGVNWVQLGTSQTINMAQNVYVGLGVASGSTTSLATATFDGVYFDSTSVPAPVITSISATSGSIGSQVVISGLGFGASQGSSVVRLTGTLVTINSWSDTSISITIPSGATSGYLVVSVAPNMNDSNPVEFTVTTQPLPVGWLDQEVGQVGVSGSATYANGTFTVKGAGMEVYGTADAFHFAYQPLSGDGTIVARIVSLQDPTGNSQAGIMIRETLGAGSTNAFLVDWTGYIYFDERTSTGGSTSNVSSLQATLPYWVKLVRSGNTFTSYTCTDGANWVPLGTSQTINMAQNVYVGLGVSSDSKTSLATATFDNLSISSTAAPAPVITSVSATTGSIGSQVEILGSAFGSAQGNSIVTLNGALVTINSWSNTSISISIPSGASSGYLVVSVAPNMDDSNPVEFTVTTQPLPAGWLDQEIGRVGVSGSATYASGTFTVKGGGAQIGGTVDAFHFAYVPLTGDGTIVARLVSLQDPSGNSEAGIMVRETLTAGSTNAFAVDWAGYFSFDARTSTGGSTSSGGSLRVTFPYWLRLVRSGNTFSAYTCSDGVSWTQLGTSQTINMAQTAYFGLAVDSALTTSLATATFDNVSVTAGAAAPVPVVTSLSPNAGAIGTSVTIGGTGFGASQGNSTLSFNGTTATSITSWSNTQIVATVPTAATTGPVTVLANNIRSNSNVVFTVIHPVINSLTPPGAAVSGIVTVSGSGFGVNQEGNQLLFNGVPASVSPWSDTSLVARVPVTATSGPVTVSIGGVTSNAVQFTVLQSLSVTAISPAAGPIGATVTITGVGFGPTQSTSVLTFNGVTATVSSWSDTQIVAAVPTGATTGPVTVQVAGIIASGPSFSLSAGIQLTDSLGNTTTYTSVEAGGVWVSSASQGPGCSTCTERGNISFTYDSAGHVLSRTDELGHTTTYTYDANGNVLTVTVPITSSTSATTSYTYNSFGEVLTATDPLGNVTTNTYDANGNLLTVTTPAPNGGTAASVTQFAYNSLGELTKITDPLNNQTTIAYFSTGLIQTITDAQSKVTTYAYDSKGNRTSVTDANSKQTTFVYDAMNRLTKITYPDSTTTQFGYDIRGRRTSVTDQNGKQTTYAYDDSDRLTSVTDAANNVTTYGYDTESNLTSIKDANNNTTSFTYDAFGRVTQTTFPSGHVENYSYDNVGNLTSKTDRKNQLITYTYDQLNRLTLKTYPDTTTVNYTYDNDSRLTQVSDPTGTYQFTFDNMGRLTGTTTSYAFLSGRNFTTGYGYDAASNRTSFTDPESGSTAYIYDTLNRLQTLTPPAAISGGSFGFGYDALSRRTSLTRPNTVNTSYTYDNLSRLLSVTHAKGGVTLDGATYTVDNAGNRNSKADLYAGVTTNYGYDNIYELLSATQGASTTESYTYDPVGNRLSNLSGSGWSNNTSNELTSRPGVTYTYDNNGNTLTKIDSTGTTNYTWDYENRMTSVTLPGSGGTVTFKYDPLGRRIYKSSSSGTSVYAYDGDNLVEETNSAGATIARYTQGLNIDEPLAMLRSSTTSYYQADGLGSVTSLTNAAGTAAQNYTYDSFGNIIATTGSLVNSFRYTGREWDTETSLHYYRARYYDASSGRFNREDSASFAAGVNFYAYAVNSPLNFDDPTGFCPCDKNNCVPRSSLPPDTRLALALMKQASKLTGVTYYVGIQGSYARTKLGFGYSVGGGAGMATDPQGNEAMILSPGGGATFGTPGVSGGIQVGAATFPDVSGFCGNSYGGEASGGLGLNVGGGYNTNSSGVFTFANVSIAVGKSFDVSPKTISNGAMVKLVCKQ